MGAAMITANVTLSAAQQAAAFDAGAGGFGVGLIVVISMISTLCIFLILGGGQR